MWCILLILYSRPAFLPDPNDGSLYSLGGKNNEGLTVRGNHFLSQTIISYVRNVQLSSLFYRKTYPLTTYVYISHAKSNAPSLWSCSCECAWSPYIVTGQYSMLWFSNVHSFILLQQKLPFTIPELVQASPCRSSDGVLYMGKAISQIGLFWLNILFCSFLIHKHVQSMSQCVCPHLNDLVLSGFNQISYTSFKFYATCGCSLCSFEFTAVNRGKLIYHSDCVSLFEGKQLTFASLQSLSVKLLFSFNWSCCWHKAYWRCKGLEVLQAQILTV